MEVPKFPRFDELELDHELRKLILDKGGKAGVLEWILKKDESIRGFNLTPLDYEFNLEDMKEIAKKNNHDLLIRSNNICEILPGTKKEILSLSM